MFGPGSITTASSLRADFAYDLVWVPVLATILMLCFVNLSVRIGLTTDRSPIATVSAKFGRVVGTLVGLGAFLVAASFQAGNSVGTGAASQVLFGGNTALFAALFTALAIGFLWLPRFYQNLEKTMVVIIVAMLVIYVITAVISRPDLLELAKGLIPSIASGSSALVVAAVATGFSIVGAFYQIQLVREKGWTEEQFPEARRDAALGSVILGALSVVIMTAAAAVLNPVGATVSSPADMAVILTAQAVTILVVPLIGVALVILARSKDRGSLRIGIPQLLLALFGMLFLLVLAVQYLVNLFG